MPEAAARGVQALPASTLQALEAAAVAGFSGAADPTQVVTVAWALAWAGHEPGRQYLELLQAAAASGSLLGASGSAQRLGAAHRAVLLWCAAMHGAASPPVWESGLRAVAAASSPAAKGLDECALLYLLHAALLYGADAAPPGRRAAAAASGPGGAVSPTSPAAASAASPACQPRATREEVLSAAAPLGRKALERLAAAYGEYVPLHPAIEGPYMALVYVLEQLAVGGGGGGGGGASRTASAAAAEGQWAPPGAAAAAAAVLGTPKELARIKRDLLYHWRGDTLVDEVQRVRNQVVYLLTRRLGLTVSQPDDVDVAVPSRWLAIYVRGGGGGAGRGGGGADGGGPAAAEAGAASVSELLSVTSEALEVLLRERFAPQIRMPSTPAASAGVGGSTDAQPLAQQQSPPVQGAGAGPAGMWAARMRQLRRLGWRVAVVDVEAWRQLTGDAEREAYLVRLLRGRA